MENESKFWIALIGAITGVTGWLIKHISNSDKHFSKAELDKLKDGVVYKDTCQATKDCFEAKLDGIENLMNSRFDNIEKLINNKK